MDFFEKVVQDLRDSGLFFSGSDEGLDGLSSFLMENYDKGLSMLEAVKYMPYQVKYIMLRSFQQAAWPGHSTAESLEGQWKYDWTNLCYYQEDASAEPNTVTQVTFQEADSDKETTYLVQAGPREARVLFNISYVRHETEFIPILFASDHYDRIVSNDSLVGPDYHLTVTIKDLGRGNTKLFNIVDIDCQTAVKEPIQAAAA